MCAREPVGAPEDRQARIQWLLSAPEEQVVAVARLQADPPPHARVRASVTCACCGERVMETRARIRDGKPCCIPCAAARDGAAA